MRNHRDENQRRRLLQQWRTQHGNICPGSPWCQPTPHQTNDLTIDHIKPQHHGGTLADGWRILCRTANSKRSNNPTPPPPSRNW